MNGDRYPDAVTSAGILFNTGSGFETSLTQVPLPLGQIRSIRHRSVSLGGSADSLMNLTDGAGDSAGFVGGSIGLSYGKSVTDTDLLDINGDGLPDRVQADPSTGNLNVYLNFGRRFGNRVVWSGAEWDNGPEATTVLNQLFQAFNDELDPDAIRVEETANNQGGISTGSFGAGATNTLVRQLVGMVDINGDGLPDQVMKLPGDETMKIKINLGDRFAPEQVIPLTAWPPGRRRATWRTVQDWVLAQRTGWASRSAPEAAGTSARPSRSARASQQAFPTATRQATWPRACRSTTSTATGPLLRHQSGWHRDRVRASESDGEDEPPQEGDPPDRR